MANNVGNLITFTLTGAPATGGGYTYVWIWWDQTTSTTTIPVVTKVLNQGGVLNFSVVQCDAYGRSQTYSSSISVSFPPAIVGSPTISNNDALFPFNTTLASVAYDPNNSGTLNYAWYDGAAFLSTGTTVVVSSGSMNSLGLYSVGSNETLTQCITNVSNGTTLINYSVRGTSPDGLQGSGNTINNSIVSSANNLSEIIIGPGQEATFTAYAQDTSPGNLAFLWTAGTQNGWSTNVVITPTTTALANGLYQSEIVLPVSAETQGVKTVVCTVTNLSTNQSIQINNIVNLLSALPPTITSISTDAPIINGGYAVSQGGYVHFSATASDPSNALLTYEWLFTQPSISLYGKTAMLLPGDYNVFAESTLVGNGTAPGTGPLPITGQVTVTDRFGQTNTVSLNQFVTALVWPSTQVSPQTSGTGSTSLQKRYWGVSLSSVLQASDLLNLNSDFSSQRNMSVSVNPVGQYEYIIYPASFGTATISLNGTIVTNWLLTTVTFNAISYNVYRSSAQTTSIDQITVS